MLIDRKQQVTDELLSSFIKLLDYDEVKLIVPDIIVEETKRNLYDELDIIGEKINESKKDIKNLYGIVVCEIDKFNIADCKKKCLKILNEVDGIYRSNKNDYIEALDKQLDKVFTHRNSIIINYDSFLSTCVSKRRVFKRAPFHIDSKESYGDGLIAEILINLKKYISLLNDDQIIFVTGNYKDFCVGKNNKETLHPHIQDDLKVSGIYDQVKCLNSFSKLICNELKQNVDNANLTEEFQDVMSTLGEANFIKAYEDQERETYNLTPFGKYKNLLEDNLSTSDFQYSIIKRFDMLNRIYRELDYNDYEEMFEKLYLIINEIPIHDLNEKIKIIKSVVEDVDMDTIVEEDISCKDLLDIINYIENKRKFLSSLNHIGMLPSRVEFGDTICITNSKNEILRLELQELYLTEEKGSTDYIELDLYDDNCNEICKGNISVTYGYYDLNDNYCVEDALDDNISYNCESIIEELDNVISEWHTLEDEFGRISDMLENEFEYN